MVDEKKAEDLKNVDKTIFRFAEPCPLSVSRNSSRHIYLYGGKNNGLKQLLQSRNNILQIKIGYLDVKLNIHGCPARKSEFYGYISYHNGYGKKLQECNIFDKVIPFHIKFFSCFMQEK